MDDVETGLREYNSPSDRAMEAGHARPKAKTSLEPPPRLIEFSSRTSDKIRFGDLDRQGHVNNSVFLTFMETGRCEILYDLDAPLTLPGTSYVIVKSILDLRGEMFWPGIVGIGTRVASIGRSSVQMKQALFQNEKCVATADIVLVHMEHQTRRSCALPPAAVARFSELMTPSA